MKALFIAGMVALSLWGVVLVGGAVLWLRENIRTRKRKKKTAALASKQSAVFTFGASCVGGETDESEKEG